MFVLLVFCFEVYFGDGTGIVYNWDPWTNQSIYVGTRNYIGSFSDMYTFLIFANENRPLFILKFQNWETRRSAWFVSSSSLITPSNLNFCPFLRNFGCLTDECRYQLLGDREAVATFQAINNSSCKKEFPFLANTGTLPFSSFASPGIPYTAHFCRPQDNFLILPFLESSFLTMSSNGGLMFGIINIIGNFGTVFIDQSNWQNAIASRSDGTVKSFFLGGLVWFCIPFTLASGLGRFIQHRGLERSKTIVVSLPCVLPVLGQTMGPRKNRHPLLSTPPDGRKTPIFWISWFSPLPGSCSDLS